MTDLTPEQKIAQVLDDYRKVCFLVKDYGLDNDRSVHLLALATINAKDDLKHLITSDFEQGKEFVIKDIKKWVKSRLNNQGRNDVITALQDRLQALKQPNGDK